MNKKKLLPRLLCITLLCMASSLSQAQWPTNGTAIYNSNTGNVGIGPGTAFAPYYKFQVYDGSGQLSNGIGLNPGSASNDNAYLISMKTPTSSDGFIIKTTNTDAYRGQSAVFLSYGYGAGNGLISLMSNVIDIRTGTNYADNITGKGYGTSALYINNNQQVGIGTTAPGTNKLAVEGTIAARKVLVTTTTPFPDYVFRPGYALPTLDSVSRFIAAHKHLSEMPSADSVARNGLDLSENQTMLVKKVEELTLYLIDQGQQLSAQQRQIREQQVLISGQARLLMQQQEVLKALEKKIGGR